MKEWLKNIQRQNNPPSLKNNQSRINFTFDLIKKNCPEVSTQIKVHEHIYTAVDQSAQIKQISDARKQQEVEKVSIVAMETGNKGHNAYREFCDDINKGDDGEHLCRLIVRIPCPVVECDVLNPSFGFLDVTDYQGTQDDDRQNGDDFYDDAVDPKQQGGILGMRFSKSCRYQKINSGVCRIVQDLLNLVERVVCRRRQKYTECYYHSG